MSETRIVSGSSWRQRAEAAEAEIRRLREQLRIATELLETLAAQRGRDMRYPGEHATLAADALTQMSTAHHRSASAGGRE